MDRGVPMAMMSEGARRYTAAVRRWINDTITKQIRAHHTIGRFPIIIATHDGERRVLHLHGDAAARRATR